MAAVKNTSRQKRAAAAAAGARRRRARRTGKRTLHYILVFLFLAAVFVTLSLTVLFRIESVTVVGTDKYPPGEVAKNSGIAEGDNIFRVNGADVSDILTRQYPYIESVNIRRKLPNAVQLEITQCKPAAALSFGDEYLLFTRGGRVLERGLIFIPEDIPIVKGVLDSGAQPGENLTLPEGDVAKMQKRLNQVTQALTDEEKTLVELAELRDEAVRLEAALENASSASSAMVMLDYLFKAMDETGFGSVTNVDITDGFNMKIVYENRLLFKLGTEAQLTDKLNFIKQIVEKNLTADAQGIVDVSDTTKNWLIYEEMPIEQAISGGVRRGLVPSVSQPAEKPDDSKPDDSESN